MLTIDKKMYVICRVDDESKVLAHGTAEIDVLQDFTNLDPTSLKLIFVDEMPPTWTSIRQAAGLDLVNFLDNNLTELDTANIIAIYNALSTLRTALTTPRFNPLTKADYELFLSSASGLLPAEQATLLNNLCAEWYDGVGFFICN